MRFFSDNSDYYAALRFYKENFELDEVNHGNKCTHGILLPREEKKVISGEIKGADDTGGSPLFSEANK